jgi:uncharacterized RDD family membrane protein YckC
MSDSGTLVPPPFGTSFPPAAPWARIGAVAIDAVGTFVVTLVLVFLLVGIGFSGYNGVSGLNDDVVLAGALGIVVIPAASVVLNLVLTIVRGSTVGKAMLGLRVVDAGTLHRATASQVLLRTLVIVAPIFAVVVLHTMLVLPTGISIGLQNLELGLVAAYWVALMVMMLRPGVRPLQDRAGHTVVVRTRVRDGETLPAHPAGAAATNPAAVSRTD